MTFALRSANVPGSDRRMAARLERERRAAEAADLVSACSCEFPLVVSTTATGHATCCEIQRRHARR